MVSTLPAGVPSCFTAVKQHSPRGPARMGEVMVVVQIQDACSQQTRSRCDHVLWAYEIACFQRI